MTATVDAPRRRAGRARDGRLLVVAVLVLAAAAWLWLALAGGHGQHGGAADPAHAHGGQADPAHAHAGVLGSAATWYLGWIVMVVAMMLPPTLPLLLTVRRLVAGRQSRAWLLAACGAAFVAVWAAAGLAFLSAGSLLSGAADRIAWVGDHPHVVSGAAAIAVGAYQFTPLKKACLTACRSPLGLAMTTWTGTRAPAAEAALIGTRFGLVCLGCCWALMALTFTVGTAAMPIMALAAVLMTAERLTPVVRPLVPAVAAGAIALGVLVLLRVLPPGLAT